MISFNVPPVAGKELIYLEEAIRSKKICGDGAFTKRCSRWLEEQTGSERVLLTTSCTHATELAAILTDIKPGDEVIMPSYTFVSTADAFVLRGAKAVFVDIRPDTMNIDETLIEDAITEKTRAIVPVHYAGVSCEMDTICDIAKRHNLYVIEDAAQGVMATYKSRPLGTIGDYGCYSFHETKNLSMGEGGALLIKDKANILRAEIVREKGTNRSQFFRGEIDKYTWMDAGSSYLPSELNAAYLWAQLEDAQKIYDDRMRSWNLYYEQLKPLADEGRIELPVIPEGCVHNAHMFYIKTRDLKERTDLIFYLKGKQINSVFHYIPLHSSPAGKRLGVFHGEDKYTTRESERLLRLPMYYGLGKENIECVTESIKNFYKGL
ncbi:dTDP-4-amino-4,6-dideoxygalactose transaminase [Lachnospiraceae bacterium AM23-2LB]|uniref:dTDP-4-amino-4,6-dideoxygalactose transaminase n=1 Tax=Mediterraneibacter glycyrrhizinilyticus TaxID=342942 RepID=UPI000E3F9082|nr:dTDP-4-amino-4,6-dideoxygalactose transaminase [Mediterraneibacter glycyrrhizinilyticus]MBS5325159.1 dTDP-4-amino-4,6-dideoxygalactose transaminase [Lachnospiraceae bacterium]MCB6309277.1 dTDP-4-amino-4,6-dideoxygalactose transaminase [Lachnospiraceae bacterium 210521-DFI.1.109]RGC71977.1 dTDP-4-amino-4,6-dideoxygalactose transaminase [Lachnospiraceae bacterium AM23-2LB]RJW04319.1 dTDP-4-amino-4,6-dideoxygalactose transaminase [Lachnospiraceae bacterium AM40-2BH]MCB6426178.1 dTDP-4-amino-4,